MNFNRSFISLAKTIVSVAIIAFLSWHYGGDSNSHISQISRPQSSSESTGVNSESRQDKAKGPTSEKPFSREVLKTLQLIENGGPFPFHQDGVVFYNREGKLPSRFSGYYHEYTVSTPGSPDRGARRIVTGAKGEVYYTEDHYDSFRKISPP